jgi:hypothetical protein
MRPDLSLVSVIVGAIGFAVCAWVAAGKNRNIVAWSVAGAFFAIPAMLLVLLLQPLTEEP